MVAHWEQWWLIGEQWWLIWSSGGVVILDCKPAVLGSNPASSLALEGLPSRMVLHCRQSSEGRQSRPKFKNELLVRQ